MSRSINDRYLRVIAGDMKRLSGNVFTEKQFKMMDSRIRRRISELGLASLEQYFAHYTDNRNVEGEKLLSLLTTHHTFFFREFESVLRLLEHLPSLVEAARSRGQKQLKVWSSACSYGHEVYTLAMFLEKHLVQSDLKFDYKILATDIDPEAVKRASNGVFRKVELDRVPLNYSQGLWDKGKGDLSSFVRIKKHVREKCSFSTHNLLESAQEFGKFDVVVVRNVLIYFDEQNVSKASQNLLSALYDPGIAVCGVSEYLDLGEGAVEKLSGPIYRHSSAQQKPAVVAEPPAVIESQKQLRTVVCIDDSRSVLSLLGKMLTSEEGFEVVGTAADGVEAQSVVQSLRPDLVTLDIHMPRMTGLQYLEQMSTDHPPVLMISSASREDKHNALKALELGASDYVEKPSLQNFKKSQDEICFKLRTLAEHSQAKKLSSLDLERQFASKSYESIELSSTQWVCVICDGEKSDFQAEVSKAELPLGRMALLRTSVVQHQLEDCGKIWQDLSLANSRSAPGFSEDQITTLAPENLSDLAHQGFNFVFLVVGDATGFFKEVFPKLKSSDKIVMEDLKINRAWIAKVDYAVPLSSSSYHIKQLFAQKQEAA
jgi:chemotaxis methyl-accepting protein methylase/CheY-like chemotaxis protein